MADFDSNLLAPTSPFSPPAPAPTPIANEGNSLGMPRRAPVAAAPAIAPDAYDPSNTSINSFQRGFHQAAADIVPQLKSLYGIVKTGIGGDGSQDIAEAQQELAFNASRGPQTQDLATARKTGDYGGYLAGKVGSLVPDIVSLAIPGGAGAAIGRGLARKAIAKAAEEVGSSVAARMAARGAFKAAGDKAARDAAFDAAADQGAARASTLLASKAGDAAGTVGSGVGAGAAMFPGTVAGHAQDVLDAANPQEAAQKALAGSAVETAIASLPAAHALAKFGAAPVLSDIAKDASKFLPAIAKGAVKEGALFAGLSVPQTAAALATHGWMKGNIDLLPPGALDTYLDSAISATLMGTVLGGTGKAAERARAAAPQALQSFNDKLQERVDSVREKIEDAMPGAKIFKQMDSVASTIGDSDAQDAFSKAYAAHYEDNRGAFRDNPDDAHVAATNAAFQQALNDVTSDGSRAALSKAWTDHLAAHAEPMGEESAGATFEQHAQNQEQPTPSPPPGFADEAINSHEAFAGGPEQDRPSARATNPIDLEDPLSNQIASAIPAHDKVWENKDLVQSMVGAAKKLFTGEDLSKNDAERLGHLEAIVGKDQIDEWAAKGPEWKSLDDAHESALKTSLDDVTSPGHADALKERMIGHVDSTPTEIELAQHQKKATQVGREAAAKAQAEGKSPDEVKEAARVSRETHLAQPVPRLFERRAGEGRTNTIIVPVDKSARTPRQQAQAKATYARGFEMESEHPGYHQIIDVQNLVQKKLATADFGGQGAYNALKSVMADLSIAGVKIKPKSIREGVQFSREGKPLTANQAAELRGELGKVAPSRVEKVRESLNPEHVAAKREAGLERENERMVEQDQSHSGADTRQGNTVEHNERAKDDQDITLAEPRETEAVLQARKPPPQDFAKVEHVSPHETTILNARRAANKAKTPAERAQITHEAGVKIGEHEIAREFEQGTMSEKRRDSELARLHDPNSGLSRRYVERNKRGEFDVVKTREAAGDNPEPLKGNERDQYDVSSGREETMKPEGPHDHAKETRMANTILKMMGIDKQVKVVPLSGADRTATKRGLYRDGVIHLNPNLHGPLRMEVLAHELGHHIINLELGTAFEKGEPGVLKELQGAFEKWQKEKAYLASDVSASRKPLFSARREQELSDGRTLRDLWETNPLKADYLANNMHEFLADHISRYLTGTEKGQGILGKFFGGIVDKLKAAYHQLFGTHEEGKFAPDEAVKKWVDSLFDRNKNNADAALQQALDHETAISATHEALRFSFADEAAETPNEETFRHTARFVRGYLTPDERQLLVRALTTGKFEQEVRDKYPQYQPLIENPQTRTEALIHLARKEFTAGTLKIGSDPVRNTLRYMQDGLLRLTGLAGTNEFAMKLLEDFNTIRARRDIAAATGATADSAYNVRRQEGDARGRAQQAMNTATQIWRDHIRDTFQKLTYSVAERLHFYEIPALRKLAGQLELEGSEHGKTYGMQTAIPNQTQRFVTKSIKALEGLNKDQVRQAMEVLQHSGKYNGTPSPEISTAVQKVRELFKELHKYADDGGLSFPRTPNYFPVVMDAKNVDANEGAFRALLQRFEPQVLERFGSIDRAVEYAKTQGADDSDRNNAGEPNFRAKNPRTMDFIYKDGTAADAADFARFQSKDMHRVVLPYIENLVRETESARRFGANDERLNALLDKAKGQGATDQQLQFARDAVDASRGRYGLQNSPFITKYFGEGVSNALTGKKGQMVSDMIAMYQNLRVLPLSLLSSLADPLGIFVNTGGDMRGSWQAFKEGIKSLGKTPTYTTELAQTLGVGGDYITADALRSGYGGQSSSNLLRSANDALFRWNGLNAWTQATRHMALAAGQGFLLRHATGHEANSVRYLTELGVKADDITPGSRPGELKILTDAQRATASKTELARDDRVRQALVRFVDRSIIRTKVSQQPLWFRDPAFKLLSQYQGFTYAFNEQILGRMKLEFEQYGNMKPLLPLLMYVPATIAAEMMRGFIQFGPSGNPNREDWGPGEWSNYGAQRAGLYGPRMGHLISGLEGKQYAAMGGVKDVGPAVSQAHDIGATLFGARSFSKTAVQALPGEAAYQHWVM